MAKNRHLFHQMLVLGMLWPGIQLQTLAQAVLIKDIYPGPVTSFSSPISKSAVDVNGVLFFTANDGTNGKELWKSDGTAAGTVMIKDIYPGNNGSKPEELTHVNGSLFFRADDGVHGDELWISDGTASGTVMVKDLWTGSSESFPQSLVNVNGTLFFSANNGMNGVELFKSDGTPTGTDIVRDIYPGLSSAWPVNLTDVNGTVFFQALDMTHGLELWKSDGTVAGTVLVKDIKQGTGSSAPDHLTAVNGTLFFSADDGSGGDELWKSDGTDMGTVLVADIYPGSGNSITAVSVLFNGNGMLYFTANDGTNGVELWRSDGTTAGTIMLKDIHPSGSSQIWEIGEMNGSIFFGADDGTNGHELWISDGTTAGTVILEDIQPGSGGSGPSLFTEVNGNLFFRADDGTNGLELWQSDGTAGGTVLVQDIHAGSQGSWPQRLTPSNSTLFFVAHEVVHGAELWNLAPPPPPPAMGIVLGVQTAGAGSMVSLSLLGNHVNGIAAYQGTISFDSTILSVDTVINSNPAISHMFGLPGMGNVPANALSFSWSDSSQGTISLPDSSLIMEVSFAINPTAPHGFTQIQLDSSVLDLGYSTDTSQSSFVPLASTMGGILVINSPPNIQTQDIIVSLDPFGLVSIDPADIDNGSSDVYGLDTLFLNINQFGCADTGAPVPVLLTGVNIYGNSASDSAWVTVLADPVISLSGAAITEDGDSIPGVIFDLSGDDGPATQTGMIYDFLTSPCVSSNDIGAEKTDDAASNDGLDVTDAYAIVRHVLLIESLNSPYQLLAANVDGDDMITVLDVVQVLRKINHIQTHFTHPITQSNDAIWLFVPDDYVFPTPIDHSQFDTRRIYVDPLPSAGQDWIGIKLGDVNDSWTPSGSN